MAAAIYGYFDLAQMLLQNGADVNATNVDGKYM